MSPRRIRVEQIGDLQVCHCSAAPGYIWEFPCTEADLGLGAYYRGTLTTVDAYRKDIIGSVFHGFWDFTQPENFKYATYGEWQKTRIEDDLEWLCFHTMTGVYRTIRMVDPDTVPAEGELLYKFDEKAVLFGR